MAMDSFYWALLVTSLCTTLVYSWDVTPSERRVLFSRLDKDSLKEQLAFARLFPNTAEGKKALVQAESLVSKHQRPGEFFTHLDTVLLFDDLLNLMQLKPEETQGISEPAKKSFESLTQGLANSHLKGSNLTEISEILKLQDSEIDLARTLLLSQIPENIPDRLEKVRLYETVFDLMALQILARLPKSPTNEEKVEAISQFLFDEMGFRFPPHSLFVDNIDLYSFLPSVVDSRRGVCLGVSILYLCLAQRLNLPLEAVTPPGHIFVRLPTEDGEINIETTARGIHLPSEIYLGINTRKLSARTTREVLGFSHFNEASLYLQKGDYERAIQSYEKALVFMPEDPLTTELLAYNYLFVGRTEEAVALLKKVVDIVSDDLVVKTTLSSDVLSGKVDGEGIKAYFSHVDQTRESLLKKRDLLDQALTHYPEFQEGWSSLGTTYLQLHQPRNALHALEQSVYLNDNDPTTHYFLAVLYLERLELKEAWEHLNKADAITAARGHFPKVLKKLKQSLRQQAYREGDSK